MPITPDQPIVVPPTGGITFDQQWVYNLVVHAPAIDSGRVLIELLPFDQSTGTIGPASLLETIQTDKLWQAASEVPEVATAMQAVIDCVGPLRAWIKTQSEPVIEE
jgi:hypothetical protein